MVEEVGQALTWVMDNAEQRYGGDPRQVGAGGGPGTCWAVAN